MPGNGFLSLGSYGLSVKSFNRIVAWEEKAESRGAESCNAGGRAGEAKPFFGGVGSVWRRGLVVGGFVDAQRLKQVADGLDAATDHGVLAVAGGEGVPGALGIRRWAGVGAATGAVLGGFG